MKSKLFLLCALAACASMQAHAVGRLADVVLVDRDSGAILPTHYHRGEYWVAGKPGARYAISVRNKLGERVMAVTSVDGVNVLSGDTASWDQTGYVFAPYLYYQITGWRKSNEEVAAFEFASASDSYAGRTGRPQNVGVIGVALFRENPPEPLAQAPEMSRRNESDREQGPARQRSAPARSSSEVADSATDLTDQAQGRLSLNERSAKATAQAMPAPKLGTGHGQRETSVVSRTSFERRQAQPNEVIRIRYDSRENLIASGVIREPIFRQPRPGANPFPLSEQASYVPDPPAR